VVPILGEGSNGGNITHPARVRDPLNTLSALIKLLSLRGDSNNQGLFEYWCRISGQEDLYSKDFTLDDIVLSLPAYVTTSAYESRALMHIKSSHQGKLKARYEEFFLKYLANRQRELSQRWGIVKWREWNYEGIESKEGMGPFYRSGAEKGGLKIELLDRQNRIQCYLWMRGSGTEPVFRIMADSRGEDAEREEYLLSWQRSLIERADESAVGFN
ncbi:MAG: phosphoglucomutase, partial [Spirochaetaceae bacterium]|nr:phosphoglucomutase [Spirochaetaceae bacterium]